jgi:hypothetical protein
VECAREARESGETARGAKGDVAVEFEKVRE